jgi:hypothetical protein
MYNVNISGATVLHMDYMETTRRLHGDYMETTRRLHGDYKETAWNTRRQHGYMVVHGNYMNTNTDLAGFSHNPQQRPTIQLPRSSFAEGFERQASRLQ